MRQEISDNITLAIDTIVCGGSVALFVDGLEIDYQIGEEKFSRSVEILEVISGLLARNGIDKQQIKTLAYASGPGNSMGARIGIATVLGLKNAILLRDVGISVLEALILGSKNQGAILTAVPFGKRDACWQRFGKKDPNGFYKNESSAPAVIREDVFGEFILSENLREVIMHRVLYDRYAALLEHHPSITDVIDAGENMAHYIGRRSFEMNASDKEYKSQV